MDLSDGQYSTSKNIRFKTFIMRSVLCDYSDAYIRDYSGAYILVKGRISVTGNNAANRRNEKLTFKKNAPFRSCISKINNKFIDNPEDLYINHVDE